MEREVVERVLVGVRGVLRWSERCVSGREWCEET